MESAGVLPRRMVCAGPSHCSSSQFFLGGSGLVWIGFRGGMGTEVGQGLLEAYRNDKGSEMGTDWDKKCFAVLKTEML